MGVRVHQDSALWEPEVGLEGKCRKNNGHDLWHRPEPQKEFR